MPIVNRPTRTIKWAESGNQAEPSTEKQELGWVIEKPPNEIMNWIHNQQDTAVQYLLQEAGVEWFVEQEYSATSQVTYNGVRYKSKIANVGKQPDLFPNVWEIAYSDYKLTTEFNKVINTVNYADKLVYKDNPIFRNTAIGTAFIANTGATQNDGFSFNGKRTDGFFHNYGSPIVLKDALLVAEFSPVTSMGENNKKVVTMDVLQKYLQQYKVGDLYITTSRDNPSTRLGYGTWERYAEGRALVGFSSSTSNSVPEWVKNGNSTFGSYTHVLTKQEMPRHKHGIVLSQEASEIKDATGFPATDNSPPFVTHTEDQPDGTLSQLNGGGNPLTSTGDNQPHNNVQPSIVVFVWKRTA